MYIVVIGGGKVGYHLARALLVAGNEVAVIESDVKKAGSLFSLLGNMVLRGDGSEPSVLESSGISRADVLIATTGADEDNLAACQMAKQRFGVEKTISCINNPENEALFQLLEVDVTVSSTQMILAEIEEELPAHLQADLLSVRGNHEVIRMEIEPGSAVADLMLKEITMPSETSVAAVISLDGKLKPLNDETLIQSHDEVVAVTTSENAEALLELFGGRER